MWFTQWFTSFEFEKVHIRVSGAISRMTMPHYYSSLEYSLKLNALYSTDSNPLSLYKLMCCTFERQMLSTKKINLCDSGTLLLKSNLMPMNLMPIDTVHRFEDLFDWSY